MRQQQVSEKEFEFYFPRLDTLVLVEESEDGVVVRATRNTFSEQHKICFIHEIATEGFISDQYQWFSGFEEMSCCHVRWLKDVSWLTLSPVQAARTRKFMVRLLLGSALLLSAMIITLFLS